MRNLAKAKVLKSAAIAALATAAACLPRLTLWSNRSYHIWYAEAVLCLGGFVLWAFVFAWHTQYTNRPVFTLELEKTPWFVATGAGIFAALVLHRFIDPSTRVQAPEDFPVNREQWIAMTLFLLGFTQLFLVFAPYDWSVRLFGRRWIAILLTVLFGVFVVAIKSRSVPVPVAPGLILMPAMVRAVTTGLSVWFYSRSGVILVWWWGFLLQTRHLFDAAN